MGDGAGSGQHRNLDEIFLNSLDLDPADRHRFVADACGDDEGLMQEVLALLVIADQSPELLSPPDIGLIPERLGPYEIVAESGRGGMGIVLEAKDLRLLRTVALKVLPHYLGRDDKFLGRFRREAQMLARLNHANIATLHSLEESDGFHFLTMEFVSGETLAEILTERRLASKEIDSLGLQIASALEAAHAVGICHCDLKPANIMVSLDGKVSLLDFGIARLFGQMDDSPVATAPLGAPMTRPTGTVGYMAPEQYAGGVVDERTDLWAFGVILFECATGRPFPWRRAEDVLDSATDLADELPSDLANIVRRCLTQDPDRRSITATDVHLYFESRLQTRPRRRVLRILAGVAGIIFLLALYRVIGSSPRGPLDHLDLPDSHRLAGLNQDGEVLWSRRFPDEIRSPILLEEYDTAGSEKRVLGCAIATNPGTGGGYVSLLDPESGRTIWRHDPAWTMPVNALGPIYYRWLVEIPWPGRRDGVLLAGIRDGLWYGFAVEAIDVSSAVLGVYHHPGPLYYKGRPPDDDPAEPRILLHGANSSARFNSELVPFETEHHPGCVVRLRLPDVAGQAYPYSEGLPENRDWPGLVRAAEDVYLLIPMIDPETDSFVDDLEVHDPRTGRVGYSAVTRDGRLVILDQDLYPLRCVLSRDGTADRIFSAGMFPDTRYWYFRNGVVERVSVPVGY